jgi:two-component system OmpR family response regulator
LTTPRVVAVVEDEAAIRENYADALKRRGYRVQAFAGRKEAMAAFASRLPDLVVIDINLGHEVDGGFELCRELRSRSASLPIIFLTARDSELDAVSGLRLGADDYLTKNISLDHLLARVAALFRRVDALESKPERDESIERGDLILDQARLTARY